MRLAATSVDRLKPLVFVLALYPLARWFYLGWQDGLTANPTEFLTRSSGTWTLVFLVLTLTVTPVRDWFNWPAIVRWRRMLGLFAFFYGCLHVLAWAWWEKNLMPVAMALDVVNRPFVTVGTAAFMVMLAMALTSNQRAMRALGSNWKKLHRWVYLVAILAIVHYWLHKAGKNDFYEVTVYGVIVLLLLVWRIWRRFRPETKTG